MQKTINLIKQFRSEIGDAWPTPSRLDSLRYCRGEIQEASDIAMRLSNPNHTRHNDHERGDIDKEMGDVAMMYLTYPISDEVATAIYDHEYLLQNDIMRYFDILSHAICKDIDDLFNTDEVGINGTYGLIAGYFKYSNLDMLEVVAARLSRIAHKRDYHCLVLDMQIHISSPYVHYQYGHNELQSIIHLTSDWHLDENAP